MLRQQLRQVRLLARQLTEDQRLALAAQVGQVSAGEFCRRYGWSAEKYRKVAQRARARLRWLMALEEHGTGSLGRSNEPDRRAGGGHSGAGPRVPPEGGGSERDRGPRP